MQSKGIRFTGSRFQAIAAKLIHLINFQVLELQKRLEAARAHIRQLPGIDYNKEEQLRQLDSLRNQLAAKQKLIRKYRNLQL